MNNKWLEKALIALFAAFAFNMVVSESAHAQWVPPRGEGSFSLEYQHIETGDHVPSKINLARNPTAQRSNQGAEVSGNIVVMDLDYAIYDRLALNVSLPYVNTRFVGKADPSHFGIQDDREPNRALQDLGVSLRYMFLTTPLFVTTSIGVNMPTHDYDTHGHAAVGKNLRVISLGASAARALNPILPGVYIQGSYSYSFTEKVEDINMNRSNASVGITYFPIDSLSFSGFWNYQNTHGGMDGSDPGFKSHPHLRHIHDTIMAEDFGRIGGNIAFFVTDWFGIYAGYFSTIDSLSENIQQLQGINLGTTTSF